MNTSDMVNIGSTTRSNISNSVGVKTPRIQQKRLVVGASNPTDETSSQDLKEFASLNNQSELAKSRMTINDQK